MDQAVMNSGDTLEVAPEMETRKQLVGLLTRHQRRILGYIHTLVPNLHDAEDILQETCQVICEKFDDFSPGTDFMAWACEIARWRVRAARTAFARSKLFFSESVNELLDQTMTRMRPEMENRGEALEQCLKKLPERDRALISARYSQGASVDDAAQQNGRSREAAYKALGRIRRVLHECVSRRAEGAAP
jgi:RNA polymerase sigma-70 factor (ECF subfamily)